MTQYLQKSFTLPANVKSITKELWMYRVGLITAKEYEAKTGKKPEGE